MMGFLGENAVPLVRPKNELEKFLLCMSFKKYYQTLWKSEKMTEEEKKDRIDNMPEEKYVLDIDLDLEIRGRVLTACN